MMLRKLLIITAVFVFHATVKAGLVSDDHSSIASSCDCTLSPSSADKQLDEIRGIRNAATAGNEAAFVSDVAIQNGWPISCNRFVNGSDYGPIGQQIIGELASNQYPHLMAGTDDIRGLCPSFDQMTDEGKQGFWVVVLGAMAWRESTCGSAEQPHRATSGTAIGLYQLNSGQEEQYYSICNRGDGKTDQRSAHCALKMLEDQLGRHNQLFSKGSYWEVLHPASPKKIYLKVEAAIRSYALCK